MSHKTITFNNTKMIEGLRKVAQSVGTTMGPKGRNVAIFDEAGGILYTKDGVTVARNISFEDYEENVGAMSAISAAQRTVATAGDGTTSCVVLMDAIVKHAQHKIALGADPMTIRAGLDAAAAEAVNFVKKHSLPADQYLDILSVATISANGSAEIAKNIADVVTKVGTNNTVNINCGQPGTPTTVAVTTGLELQIGVVSEYFIKNLNTRTTTFDTPVLDDAVNKLDPRINTFGPAAYVWCINSRLGSLLNISEQFVSVLQYIANTRVPLIIIADEISGEVHNLLATQATKNTMQVVCVNAPGYGNNKRIMLQDIAVATGATMRDTNTGENLFDNFSLAELGLVSFAKFGTQHSTLVPCDDTASKKRASEILQEISRTIDATDAVRLRDRYSMLDGGIATITIGGNTNEYIREQKDLYDDALLAARSAAEQGIVPGAGMTYVKAAEHLKQIYFASDLQPGVDAMCQALLAPASKILTNAGENPALVLDKCDQEYSGYCSRTSKHIANMFETGIIDPAKVSISVINYATNVAGMIISTDCIITPVKK